MKNSWTQYLERRNDRSTITLYIASQKFPSFLVSCAGRVRSKHDGINGLFSHTDYYIYLHCPCGSTKLPQRRRYPWRWWSRCGNPPDFLARYHTHTHIGTRAFGDWTIFCEFKNLLSTVYSSLLYPCILFEFKDRSEKWNTPQRPF